MTEDRRTNQRMADRVVIQINTAGSVIPKVGCIRDLSAGGLSFEVDEPLEKGVPLTLTFSLPIEAEAEILNSRKVGKQIRYGVRFVRFEDTEKLHLEKFIVKKLKKQ